MRRSLYVIDGHAQIYRAYYAPFPPLTSPTGEPTKAVHVFCAMLFGLLRDKKPDYLAMVLDVADSGVFRCALDPNYKAQREPPPEDLPPQMDRIVDIVQALNLPIFRLAGFEADDLMATIAERLAGEEIDIFLVSKDKDLEQLITDRVRLYDPGKDETLDAARLLETKGYTPQQVVDVQTLTGDTVDNVPGIVGVGLKTAAKLIQQYGSAEAVLANAEKLTPKLKESVKAFAKQMPITRQLVTLRRDVPFTFDLESCRTDRVSVAKVRPIFKELAFGRLSEQLETLAGREVQPSLSAPATIAPAAPLAPPGVDYRLIDSPAKLQALAEELNRQEAFAFDTETTALNPVRAQLAGIALAWKPGVAAYIPVRALGATVPLDLVVKTLSPLFADPAKRKCAQNAKYDLVVLRQVGIEVAGLWFDSMIASFLLDPLRRSHGLDALALDLLQHQMIPISDLIGRGKNQVTFDQVDPERACEYSAEDADYTWRLAEYFEPRMQASPFRALFEEVEMPLVSVLAEMEHNGVAVGRAALAEMSDLLGKRLVELTQQIHAAAGRPFNIDSTKQLAEVLFDEQGLSVVRRTKTGRSTDADTLDMLAATTGHLLPKLILEYRELTKLKGTYVDSLPKMINPRTGRIHASFHQTGAVTGRLSSSDPNLQNIPIRTEIGRKIRRAFVAGAPDHVLLTADYSQIELRVLAHFCKDPALKRAFEEGQDIHASVAAQINGIDLAQVTREQRSAAKAVNFGLIYGQTPYGLARALGIPVASAKSFMNAYFLRYPGIRAFMDDCVARVRRLGYAETLLGRRRPVQELASHNRQTAAFGERIAVNTVIQGTAADMIKKAMVNIHHRIRAERRPVKMLIQVHDELVFEIPQAHVETEAEFIRQEMAQALPLDVPIVVDVAWGRDWLEGK